MSDFEKGAKAMFDYFAVWAANHYHGDPALEKLYQKENELILEVAEDALEDVSLKSCMDWKKISLLQKEIYYLRLYGNKDCTAMAETAMKNEV